MARERLRHERFLSVLGTLGANSPFIGLFGTMLGIIKAFHDLGMTVAKGAQMQQTLMGGIWGIFGGAGRQGSDFRPSVVP